MVLNKHSAVTVFKYKTEPTSHHSEATYVAPEYLGLNFIIEDYLALISPTEGMIVSASLIPDDEKKILNKEPWDTNTLGHLLRPDEIEKCYQLKYFFKNYDVPKCLTEHNITFTVPATAELVLSAMMSLYKQVRAAGAHLGALHPDYSIYEVHTTNREGKTVSERYTMPSRVKLDYLVRNVFPRFRLPVNSVQQIEAGIPFDSGQWFTPETVEHTYLEEYLAEKIGTNEPLRADEQEHMGRILTTKETAELWGLQDTLVRDESDNLIEGLGKTPEFHTLAPKSIHETVDTLIKVHHLLTQKESLTEKNRDHKHT